MSKRVPKSQEQVLAERLRREAIESRPEFSESLHRRIACAVKQHHVAAHAAVTTGWRRGLATALAAACLLCAVAIGWRLSQSDPQQNPVGDPQAIAQASILIDQWTDQATSGLDGLVASASFKPHTAQLKHDAQLIADTILEPLPVDVNLVSDP